MMEAPRNVISELNFGKSSETEVCVSTQCFQLAMSWINEVEIVKSIDDLMTSQ